MVPNACTSCGHWIEQVDIVDFFRDGIKMDLVLKHGMTRHWSVVEQQPWLYYSRLTILL